MEKIKTKKGPALQFSGCVLVSVGFLNSMLDMKAGSSPEAFNLVFFALGALCLAAGLWRARPRA